MADRNTAPLSEGETPATEPLDRNDPRVRRIVEILRTAEAEAAAAPAFAVPPRRYGAFDDLYARLQFIQFAADALKGLASLMQPMHSSGDEQLNLALRSEATAVFRFFGEALKDPAEEAYNDAERLERAAKGERV